MIKDKETREFLKSLNAEMRKDDITFSDISIQHQETYEEYQARTAEEKAAEEKELAEIKMGTKTIEFSDSVVESLRANVLKPLNDEVQKGAEYQATLMPKGKPEGMEELEHLLDLEHEKLNDAELRLHTATVTDNSEALSKAVQDRDSIIENINDYENKIDELKAAAT